MIEGFAVVERVPVLWGDMDAFGHVNNTRFIRWFETARIAHFRRVGIKTAEAVGIAPILAHVSCDFLSPVDFPADILVGARTTKLGTTSMIHEYVVARADNPQQPVAKGTGVIVMYDYDAAEKAPIPEDLKQRIRDLDGDSL
ncbi:MAG: acyl-CoA thioesterase [Acidimicrobiia bacterium]|nr:acyl-CoA thioesterase [Acidimicrobiia bacterium]NNF09689.1 acyl-CoA thioesterase [Acidimicrobiia bacterium]NNL68816.1 acyl-CoA thioesterase [Acidimicrobiia bacterium]